MSALSSRRFRFSFLPMVPVDSEKRAPKSSDVHVFRPPESVFIKSHKVPDLNPCKSPPSSDDSSVCRRSESVSGMMSSPSSPSDSLSLLGWDVDVDAMKDRNYEILVQNRNGTITL